MLPLKLQGLPVTSDPWGTQLGSPQLKENYSCPSPLEEGSLRAHNFYRVRHGSSELTLSQMLSDSAKKWAEILSRMKYIHHSSRNIRGIRIGENIAVILSNKPVICSGEEVTAQWYNEVEQYNYEQGGDTSTCDCLETHNKYRHQHNSPPLHLSEQLSKMAQKWAESVAKESYISYSSQLYRGQQIGQNIVFRWTKQGAAFSGKPGKVDCQNTDKDGDGSEVADLWYSQVKNFDFSHYKHRMDTGHFTQLVWKNSQYIGIGKAGNSVGAVAVVVFYFPAGNIQEELQDNVFKTF
uniref:SCP domain-containing protein n=1 Tax=Octopus bimaculoides TaxID=37653 RepID=A0A0L8HZI0_OCTBM